MKRLATVLVLALAGCDDRGAEATPDASSFADAQVIDGSPFPFADADPGPFCELPTITCHAPEPGRMTICGRVLDAETSQPARPAGRPAYALGTMPAAGFALDPGAAELTATTDPCGQFELRDVEVPADGRVVVVADDSGPDDAYRLTATALQAIPDGFNAFGAVFLARETSEDAWSSSAGMTTTSFGDEGGLLLLFLDNTIASGAPTLPGSPTKGVTVQRDAAAIGDDDFYFGNTDQAFRSTVAAGLSKTGANGAVLVRATAGAVYTGVGAEPGGYRWPSVTLEPTPGAITVQLLMPEAATP
jgi:hypothetical protein